MKTNHGRFVCKDFYNNNNNIHVQSKKENNINISHNYTIYNYGIKLGKSPYYKDQTNGIHFGTLPRNAGTSRPTLTVKTIWPQKR